MSDFKKIVIEWDVEINENNQKYDDEDSTENFYNKNNEIFI